LKSDCRILNINIKLVTSPIAVDNQAISFESDASQWLISEPGNKFCVIDKPYHKSQTKEPAMAVCIDDATIFGHFSRIARIAQIILHMSRMNIGNNNLIKIFIYSAMDGFSPYGSVVQDMV
ncbi:hypothetical protein T02_8137, partial [Trichinella nativa]